MGIADFVLCSKPRAVYGGIGKPSEIVHRICTIVGHRGGNVVE
jgi:hypothetical protein